MPSVALAITNDLPAALTLAQSMVPCQWETSMPSLNEDVETFLNSPVAAYTALTPYSDETLLLLTAVIRYQDEPETVDGQSAAQDPPDTVLDALMTEPASMVAL